jgi:hypothetical protein
LIVWNFSLADFWHNLTFYRCSNWDITDLRHSQKTTLYNSNSFLRVHPAHGSSSRLDERRTDMAPSRGSTYPL